MGTLLRVLSKRAAHYYYRRSRSNSFLTITYHKPASLFIAAKQKVTERVQHGSQILACFTFKLVSLTRLRSSPEIGTGKPEVYFSLPIGQPIRYPKRYIANNVEHRRTETRRTTVLHLSTFVLYGSAFFPARK